MGCFDPAVRKPLAAPSPSSHLTEAEQLNCLPGQELWATGFWLWISLVRLSVGHTVYCCTTASEMLLPGSLLLTLSISHHLLPLCALIFRRCMRQPTENTTVFWFILQLCSVCLMWADRLVALQPPGCCCILKTLDKVWRNNGCVCVKL